MNELQNRLAHGRPNDLLIDTATLPWVRVFDGLEIQMLNWDPSSGAYALMMRYKAGYVAPRHRHLAPAEFYVISGHMTYAAGSATAGSWGVEPTGIEHDRTSFLEDTVLLYRAAGAIVALDDDGNTLNVIEGRTLYELSTGVRGHL